MAGLAGLVLFLILLFGAKLGPFRPVDFLRDPAALHGFNPFHGMVSILGILALACSGTVCLFAARHCRHEASFLSAAGLFSLVIAADDLFLLHEEVGPHWLGLPEPAILAAYGLAAVAIAVRFRDRLFGADPLGLWLALVFLSGSVLSDQFEVVHGQNGYILEDGLKFVGLVTWAGFWIGRAGQALGRR
ncbi:hypothetical protein LHP98_17110 [Rhodobacter sp. Har01]|uniref:hypothetical protein n=1 Tax=Rhodobacter sp. Har01 TaxID=2883999 RepID=UPI001D06C5E4|nr:hypothetical protein [Rhodobacter sp. Har01]MCB6179843.1 hypothetical protein [Rhodobacter sp. Har01]